LKIGDRVRTAYTDDRYDGCVGTVVEGSTPEGYLRVKLDSYKTPLPFHRGELSLLPSSFKVGDIVEVSYSSPAWCGTAKVVLVYENSINVEMLSGKFRGQLGGFSTENLTLVASPSTQCAITNVTTQYVSVFTSKKCLALKGLPGMHEYAHIPLSTDEALALLRQLEEALS
jgi:hypothetical protein